MSAFDQGYNGYRTGKTLGDNPHITTEVQTREYFRMLEWQLGWYEALNDSAKAA